jgi:hypothetical protein
MAAYWILMVLAIAALIAPLVFPGLPAAVKYGSYAASLILFILAFRSARLRRGAAKRLSLIELYRLGETHGIDMDGDARGQFTRAIRQAAIRGYLPIFGRDRRGAPASLDDPRARDDDRNPLVAVSPDHLRAHDIADAVSLEDGSNVGFQTVSPDGRASRDVFYDLHVDAAVATELMRSWRRNVLIGAGSD